MSTEKAVESVGRLLAVFAVLLPVMGVLTRLASFWASPVEIPSFFLAWRAPLAQLGLIGFLAGIPTVLALLVMSLTPGPTLVRFRARHRSQEQTRRVKRRLGLLSLVLLLLLVIAPGWPFFPIGVAVGALSGTIVTRHAIRGTRVPGWTLLALVSMMAFFSSVTLGLGGQYGGTLINVASESDGTEKPYIWIGEGDGLVYLLPCSKSPEVQVVAVTSTALEGSGLSPGSVPRRPLANLLHILQGRPIDYGLSPLCD